MKPPEVKRVGNLFDRLGEVCTPKDIATFSVGDWVWARHLGRNQRLYLARIESATPIHAPGGEVWAVRLYKSGKGWQPGLEHRRIKGPLTPVEVAHNRKIGLIPPAGQALP